MFVASRVTGQSFTTQHDTVSLNTSVFGSALNGIQNTTSSNITIQWKVAATDFPSDWIAATGYCDNVLCYTGTDIWPSSGPVPVYESNPIAPSALVDFHLQFNPAAASMGCHYMRVRLNNKFAVNDTAWQTFIVCKSPLGVTAVKSADDISMYPNPATNELNVVFEGTPDVKNIAVYNIIGKVVSVYKTTGNSANLNLENIPSGIYFARLMNSSGQVVVTRKFTKQ